MFSFIYLFIFFPILKRIEINDKESKKKKKKKGARASLYYGPFFSFQNVS